MTSNGQVEACAGNIIMERIAYPLDLRKSCANWSSKWNCFQFVAPAIERTYVKFKLFGLAFLLLISLQPQNAKLVNQVNKRSLGATREKLPLHTPSQLKFYLRCHQKIMTMFFPSNRKRKFKETTSSQPTEALLMGNFANWKGFSSFHYAHSFAFYPHFLPFTFELVHFSRSLCREIYEFHLGAKWSLPLNSRHLQARKWKSC